MKSQLTSAVAWILSSLVPAGAKSAPMTAVQLTRVDDRATGYATFQSHNQKLVSNGRGIFMTYIRTRNEKYTAQMWRLIRIADGRVSTIHESTDATSAPAIETDASGNLYLARPDFVDGNAYLYRFLAADDHARPTISVVPGGAAGKYCMTLDRQRGQLYYFAHNNTFHVIGLDGVVRRSVTLLASGKSALLQYPHLSLARDGKLHAGWTTQKHGVYLYWDIHHMLSPDGGVSWTTLSGRGLTPPVIADEGGPATGLIRDDEYAAHTWLSNLVAKDGKVHFLYMAQTAPPRQHYVRLDGTTGDEDHRLSPTFRGQDIALLGLSGFFATRADLDGSPLYCIGPSGGRIACLASDDNGTTWYDYAISEQSFSPYAVGGCRDLTSDGHILGSFTDQRCSTTDAQGECHVYFFRIRAGLSEARPVRGEATGGKRRVTFADVRGQPDQVRFRTTDGPWGEWKPFRKSLDVAETATRCQLRSRLGVVSREIPLQPSRAPQAAGSERHRLRSEARAAVRDPRREPHGRAHRLDAGRGGMSSLPANVQGPLRDRGAFRGVGGSP